MMPGSQHSTCKWPSAPIPPNRPHVHRSDGCGYCAMRTFHNSRLLELEALQTLLTRLETISTVDIEKGDTIVPDSLEVISLIPESRRPCRALTRYTEWPPSQAREVPLDRAWLKRSLAGVKRELDNLTSLFGHSYKEALGVVEHVGTNADRVLMSTAKGDFAIKREEIIEALNQAGEKLSESGWTPFPLDSTVATDP